MWKANIQKATVTLDGRIVKVTLCTRCLRTLSKA
jgi:ribosomal protein L28